jgi:hypothetical protein
MDRKYKLKVVRSKWHFFYLGKNLPEDIDNEATLVIKLNGIEKVKRTRKKFTAFCLSFEIIKEESLGKWNIRFLIEPRFDGVVIEAPEGFSIESVKRVKEND